MHTQFSLISDAQLVELVDTLGLEPNARAWGFESLTGHHKLSWNFKSLGLAPGAFFFDFHSPVFNHHNTHFYGSTRLIVGSLLKSSESKSFSDFQTLD
jgi:hypothetical protein